MAELIVNSVYEYVDINDGDGKLQRILWISTSGKDIVTISLDKKNPLPEWRNRDVFYEEIRLQKVRKCEFIEFKNIVGENASKKNILRRDQAWEIISALVEDEPGIYIKDNRGTKVIETAQKYSKHPMTIYKYLRQYWQGGKTPNALLPNFDSCGGRGKERNMNEGVKRGRPPKLAALSDDIVGVNVDSKMKEIFNKAYRKFYLDENLSMKHAYEQMLAHYFNVGYRQDAMGFIPMLPPIEELPTYPQFRYWIKKNQDLKEKLIATKGKKQYELNHREVLGNSTQMAFGPGSLFQIDATPADVYLVSSLNRKAIVGKPTVYVVIDVFSRLIVGIYVGIEEPSWVAAMMAICNAVSDKVEFCAEYDIPITPNQWPCKYLPSAIIADRGELEGYNINPLINNLGVRVSNTPPYRADWKGIVERSFGMIKQNSIYRLPGAVQERTRGDHDYRLDAILTDKQFTQIIIKTVLQYNLHHRMDWYPMQEFLIENEVKPIPIDLWNWGVQHRNGNLKEIPVDIVKLNLLPRDEATVTEAGIRFKGMFYSCKTAITEQWFIRARTKQTWKVPIAYDPRNVTKLYIVSNDGRNYDICELLDTQKQFKNRRMQEILLYNEGRSIEQKEHVSRELQSRVELNAFVDQIISQAKETKDNQYDSVSKNSRLKNIKNNRRNEKELNRQTEKWDLAQEKHTENTGQLIEYSSNSDEVYKSKKLQDLEYLKKLRLQRKAEENE